MSTSCGFSSGERPPVNETKGGRMSKAARVPLSLILCLVVIAPAFARETDEEGIQGVEALGLEKQSFQAGETLFDVHAGRSVDVQALVRDIRNGDSAQAIYDKVNATRRKLYSNEEIILSVGGGVKSASSLVQLIVWWNSSNRSGSHWWARYFSTTAVMFTDNIAGTYDIYDRAGSGGWVLRYRVGSGGAYTRSNWGSYMLRGFRGTAVGNSRADIVIWFWQ